MAGSPHVLYLPDQVLDDCWLPGPVQEGDYLVVAWTLYEVERCKPSRTDRKVTQAWLIAGPSEA